MMDEYGRQLRLERVEVIRMDKSPYLDMFNVFEEMNLRGMSIVQALSIVTLRAKETYKDLEIQINPQKVHAFKYEAGKFMPAILPEDKVLMEINKSLGTLDYDAAIYNLQALVNFYKEGYYRAIAYKYFYDYMQALLKKFQEINELIKTFEQSKLEIDQLKQQNMQLLKEAETYKSQRDYVVETARKYEKEFQNLFANKRVTEFFLGNMNSMMIKSNKGVSMMQIVLMIINEGRLSVTDIAKTFKVSKKELLIAMEEYPELFIIHENEYIDLNFQQQEISKKAIMQDIDSWMKDKGLNKILLKEAKFDESQDTDRETTNE